MDEAAIWGEGGLGGGAHGGHEAVVEVLIGEEDPVLDEDGAGPQDEGGEQVDVDVVPGAVELPAGRIPGRHGKCGCFQVDYCYVSTAIVNKV